MVRRSVLILSVVFGALALASCGSKDAGTSPAQSLGNPASIYCEEQGGTLEFRQDAFGGTAGICLFPDGSECDEWAAFRQECGPGDSLAAPGPAVSPGVTAPEANAYPAPVDAAPEATSDLAADGCRVYRNADVLYSFHYPANTVIGVNEEPLNSISIGPVTAGEGWPAISISHPRDREDYRPPEGADLLAWLTDHNLVGEERLADVQIGGTTAIHYRHERSPQSFAYDRYYFAHAGQLYMIVIGHTDDREDWDMYDHFLTSFRFDA